MADGISHADPQPRDGTLEDGAPLSDAERELLRTGRFHGPGAGPRAPRTGPGASSVPGTSSAPGASTAPGGTTSAPTIRASVLRRLLTGEPGPDGARTPCPAPGVRVRGASIMGRLDLARAARPGDGPLPALVLEACHLEEGLDLTGARIASLSLTGSHCSILVAPGLHSRGAVDLSDLRPPPGTDVCTVDLRGAVLAGGLEAPRAALATPPPRPAGDRDASSGDTRYALDLREARVHRSLVLQPEFVALGGVALGRARIEGEAWLCGARLVAGEGSALHGAGAVLGSLILEADERPDGTILPARLEGEVGLAQARLRGGLWITAATSLLDEDVRPSWAHAEGWTLQASRITIAADLDVDLRDVPDQDSGAPLRCEGLALDGAAVRGSAVFQGLRIDGSMEMMDASVKGGLILGSAFDPGGSFQAHRLVLHRTRIGGSMELAGCTVANRDGSGGIFADDLVVADDLYLCSASGYCQARRFEDPQGWDRPGTVEGPIFLQEADVGGTLWIVGATIRNVNMQRGTVGGTIQVRDSTAGSLDLEESSIGGSLRVVESRLDLLDVQRSRIRGAVHLARTTTLLLEASGAHLGSLRLDRLRLQAANRDLPWLRVKLSDMQIDGEVTVSRLQVDPPGDERTLRAVQRISRLRRRKLTCYEGWWLVEAETVVEAGNVAPGSDAPGGGAAAEGGAERAVLSFLWKEPGPLSWRAEGAAVLLDGSSRPFHSLNEAWPPRFDGLRRRYALKEYLVLFASYLWGDEGPFRIVRREDLERLAIPFELAEGGEFQAIRVEDGGAADHGASPVVVCTVLYGGALFSARLRISSTGDVAMEGDEVIGGLTEDAGERYEAPFRMVDRAGGDPLPGMLPEGAAVERGVGLAGLGWWGRWAPVDPESDTGRRMLTAFEEALAPPPRIDLSNARAARLNDADGLGWGEQVRLKLDGFGYARTPRPDFSRVLRELEGRAAGGPVASRSERLRRRGRNGLRRLLGRPAVGPVPTGSGRGQDRFRHRERWLDLQYDFGSQNAWEYRPHPYETLSGALRNEGAMKDARRVLSHKLTLERRVRTSWYLRPFVWTFWAAFDYGLSTTRAAVTVLLFGMAGWLGTEYANSRGLLVIDFRPAATALAEQAPGEDRTGSPQPGIVRAEGVTTDVACGSTIVEPIYAMDLMVPIIELGQEDLCRIRTTRVDQARLHVPWLWETLRSLYKVGGAIVLSIALLTFSGVLRRHAES